MLTLTAPPAGEPLSLPDVKAALRIDTDAEDAFLSRMIATARSFVERRLDLAILTQSWALSLDALPLGPVSLRPGKVQRIVSGEVAYGDGPARPLGDGEVRLVRSVPARACFRLPARQDGMPVTALSLTFEAGWAPAAVPPELIHALTLLVAHYHEERQLFAEGRYVPVPAGLQAHLEAFREARL